MANPHSRRRLRLARAHARRADDLEGLHQLCERGPASIDVAAGEYGYDLPYFQRTLDPGAVDCLQADVTRCLGITGVLKVGALCDARSMNLSLHCAPQISAHVEAALWRLRHLEYFHDHVRIENMAFDGALQPQPGGLRRPDRTAPGHGLTAKHPDISRCAYADAPCKRTNRVLIPTI